MRIVLDTNVLVSGLLSPHGPPGRVIDLSVSGGLTLLVDDRVLAEYQEVLARPRFGFRREDREALLGFYPHEAERIVAPPLLVELDVPDDKPFIEVAVAGKAEALVTGNMRHFSMACEQHAICLLSPAALIARVTG